ncbi:XRE family transcriptional regulator [Chryseolinea lacunae]|uniref:LexA family transcriptional regulator n=1 Tax=Chryseolinea lacunae TaxID=2801331 RepID=A0ABS1KTB2_9BACT|nr:LexA family transcriptional regulator [Chryseolinea lacunae]MBL0742595.1 LexA family transcriptional regulator [Chryseolinea lacunae]
MAMVNKNLKFLRTQQGLTQKQLAEKMGLKQAAIGAYEEERSTPPLASLLDITKIFNVNLDALVRHDLSRMPEKERKANTPSKGKDVLTITVDSHNKENVELVSQKASAGYLAGYQDVEFVKDLPKISMPVLPKNRTYRAFEIQGDSMLPVQPGSIIFGEYMEDVASVKNGKLYIIVTKQDGIVFKRLFNFTAEEGKVLLVSDNRQYEPYSIEADDVLEIWQAKAFFSNQFPDPQGATAVSTDHLAHTVLTLQAEIQKLKKK